MMRMHTSRSRSTANSLTLCALQSPLVCFFASIAALLRVLAYHLPLCLVASPQGEHPYIAFWNEFSKSIKMGVMEDSANRSKLVKLMRFKTNKSEDKWISLEDYVAGMPEWQSSIFYIAGESTEVGLISGVRVSARRFFSFRFLVLVVTVGHELSVVKTALLLPLLLLSLLRVLINRIMYWVSQPRVFGAVFSPQTPCSITLLYLYARIRGLYAVFHVSVFAHLICLHVCDLRPWRNRPSWRKSTRRGWRCST